MNRISYLCIFAMTLVFVILGSHNIMAQCPNCTIVIPAGTPGDTIVVDSLPAATKNAYYEESMSYRMPYTTDPLAAVAPPGTSIPSGLSVDHFRILSVTGMPPGLSWTGDRPTPMTYDEVAPDTRDGCITLCGIPGASGTFMVNVNIEIMVSGFVFPSPPLPLEFIVLPDPNAPFAVDTSNGCAPFGVVINNLVPSNGNTGFSYQWDFNNGTTSTDENPDTVWYDFGITNDTVIGIEQQVIIDTFPYLLEAVVVAADPGNSCNDDVLFGAVTNAPDMYMILKLNGVEIINTDPNFNLIGNTANDEYPRDTMVFPGPLVLNNGQTYELEIWDDDNSILNADDPCGIGPMPFTTTLGAGVHTLTSGTMDVEITISHYVDTITYVDSVTVNYCNTPINYINQIDRTLKVFPNPTSDLVNVRFNLNDATENVQVVVSDLLGRIVFDQTNEDLVGEYNQQIDLSNHTNGV
ncbi:T9SS type A sorting domain-containing protein, partial [Aureispira]|nr:T9SS type A sorting domain-containing protein [Aureispira sp.]